MKEAKSIVDALFSRLKSLPDNQLPRDIIILESQHAYHPESNQTYVAGFSKQYLEVKNGAVEWKTAKGSLRADEDLWTVLKRFRESAGWMFGFIGYDAAVQPAVRHPENESYYDAPDLFFMEPDYLFRIDGDGVEQLLGDDINLKNTYKSAGFSLQDISPELSKDDYIQTVRQIKHLIAEGDFYELNFSYPMTADFEGSPYELYRRMREINPVPFASYIEIEGGRLSVCCSSPERFLRKQNKRIISEPIKGTSARSSDVEEDARFRDELKNEKNEAENLMIVDLVRHDLSAVCEPGSIEVSKLFEIQTFGTVHQLISRVEGTITDHADPVDVIRACFPMGSMTGAPKIRVMKRTEELENYRRGIYSGAIGYITPDGDFDFNVVIRSAIIKGNKLVYPVGGAITGDSDPDEEWSETLLKSKVLQLVQNKKDVK
ncbi:anthranilate synthase component I family protein [Rhodohalobacter sp. 8-1]|uniref:anthranilate synthase component I family protein n=1 Tax=Rhodohalobacter sp. 8-1 TaxID=3131972 RepID=UPI0030EC647E